MRDNATALSFYTNKMKYMIDSTSPSFDVDEDASYEILSKVVDPELAREMAMAEAGASSGAGGM